MAKPFLFCLNWLLFLIFLIITIYLTALDYAMKRQIRCPEIFNLLSKASEKREDPKREI